VSRGSRGTALRVGGILVVALFAAPGFAKPKPPVGAPTAPREGDPPPAPKPPNPGSDGVNDARLAALLDEHWDATMAASPTWATQLGDHRFDDRLEDPSPTGRAAWRTREEAWLARAKAIPSLRGEDALDRDVFVVELEDALAVEDACDFPEWSFSARGNAFQYAADLGREHPLATRADADAFVRRYHALPRYLDVTVDDLRAGLEKHLTTNRASVEKVLAMVDAELAAPPEQQALLAITREPHPGLSDGENTQFGQDLAAEVRGPIRKALQRYREFLKFELLPKARGPGEEGLSALPLGPACYAARARQETTTALTPAQIHQAGLDELEKIHAEMAPLGERLFRVHTRADLFAHLRDDPSLHFDTREAVQAKADDALARARAAIPRFFGRLPKADCVVKPIPDHEAPYQTIAYYWPAAPDGSAPGVYYVNTWEPTSRTRFDAEVLAYHESIPGHHLQIALANEAPGLPAFRRYGSFTAFVEGWALYTERLADEMGLYSGDLDRLGMLGFDTWRASRLVVDTGIHDLGWSRDEAIAFMLENTPLARNNIENEVDRYITWPGQALGYKVGQMELRRMRREAESALGPRFSLPGFHDTVLGGGALPLGVVEARVKGWVASQ